MDSIEEIPNFVGWKYNHTTIYGKLFRFNKKAAFGVLSWKKSNYNQHINIITLLIELYIIQYCSFLTVIVSFMIIFGLYSFVIYNNIKPTLVVMAGVSSKSFLKTTNIIMSKMEELTKKYDMIHIINWNCFKDEQTAYCNTTSMLQKVVSEKEFYNQVAVFVDSLINELNLTNVHFLGKCAGAGVGIRLVCFYLKYKALYLASPSSPNSLEPLLKYRSGHIVIKMAWNEDDMFEFNWHKKVVSKDEKERYEDILKQHNIHYESYMFGEGYGHEIHPDFLTML